MNRKNALLLGLVAALVVVVALVFVMRQPAPPPTVAPPPQPPPVAVTPPAPPPTEVTPPPAEPTKMVEVPETPPEPTGPYLKIQPGEVLATVNGVQITLKDLIALGGAQANTPQTMSPEMYKFLLDLAIEREVTFQTAKSQGVELTEEQKQQIDQLREQMMAAEVDETEGKVVAHLNRTGSLDDQIAFDVKDATSHLLQNTLMTKNGAPSPYVTEALVQAYYQNHFQDYSALPTDPVARDEAWQKIDVEIRQKLAPIVQQEYAQRLKAYLDQLRASANVQVNEVTP